MGAVKNKVHELVDSLTDDQAERVLEVRGKRSSPGFAGITAGHDRPARLARPYGVLASDLIWSIFRPMVKQLRVSEDFVPVSEFKAQAAELLKRVADSRQPLVITQNGRPAGVLLSPAAYDDLMERSAFVAAVSAGLSDVEAGRTEAHAVVAGRLRKKYPAR